MVTLQPLTPMQETRLLAAAFSASGAPAEKLPGLLADMDRFEMDWPWADFRDIARGLDSDNPRQARLTLDEALRSLCVCLASRGAADWTNRSARHYAWQDRADLR